MNWEARLKRALQAGTFTRVDRAKVNKWNSCAISEHPDFAKHGLKSKSHRQISTSLTREIHSLGMRFSDEVIHDQIELATHTYHEIQNTKRLLH